MVSFLRPPTGGLKDNRQAFQYLIQKTRGIEFEEIYFL